MISSEDSGKPTWIERFLSAYYTRRPVNATFVGLHEHDHRLPDVSKRGLEATVGEMRALLSEGPSDDGSATEDSPSQTSDVGGNDVWGSGEFAALDRRLAEGFLRIQIWEHESGFVLENPSIHAGEAVFAMMSLLLPGSAPPDGEVEALVSRMHGLADYLRQACELLDTAPTAWTERAIRECRGGLAFLGDGASRLAVDLGEAPGRAASAIEAFGSFLEDELIHRPSERISCGSEAFARYLTDGHFLDRSADEIVAYAREELARTEEWLEGSAADFGSDDPAQVLDQLSDYHPAASEYYDRFGETWASMRTLALERELLTWPDFPIRYRPRPEWSRAAAPDLYFLFYRSPAAVGRPKVHDYLLAPLDPSGSTAEQESFLRANNDSVIKLNHVVHHGGIGHHVQNWHAFRSPSRIGRIAAVDCPSRIAMFCGGTMAEGWACYATDLMAEAGGLTPLEVYAEHHSRMRMCARAIVDVELHHGRMSLDEAAAFYVGRAGMSTSAARAEAVKNSMFPAAALMYLVGTDLIHELRGDIMRALGDDFVLRDFHDAFLSFGSIPVKLVADEMRRRAGRGLPLGAHADPSGAS